MTWATQGAGRDGWEPAIYNESDSEQTDYWSSLQPEILRHTYSGGISIAVCKLAYGVWKLPFFQVVFIGSIAYAATAITRKVFEDYTFCQDATHAAIRLVNSVYGIRPLIAIISSIFLTTIPPLSITLAIGLGVLQGLTNEINIFRHLTESRRDANNT